MHKQDMEDKVKMELQEESQTAEVMAQMIEIEKLAEEILSSRSIITEYNSRKDQNKEALNALKQGEVQSGFFLVTVDAKLWMNFSRMFIKVDRKRLLHLIEGDQAKLTKAIEDERAAMKEKIEKLHTFNTNLIELDGYVRELLAREERLKAREAKTGKKTQLHKVEEVNSDDEDD
eukprot:TRINITY_DN6235_c0_g2_i2.p1 TRINITY_DN6235_c0_g2~~TRINITY_DN6235_c0_g2_i2.p1  ORF type:complete len:175 (-),score=62.22 TRINITY_DN6235_c0_g2_i2:145-669(-)